MSSLQVLFVEDGAQTAESVAQWLADIIAAARIRVDLAIYDCHLEGESAAILVSAHPIEQARAIVTGEEAGWGAGGRARRAPSSPR